MAAKLILSLNNQEISQIPLERTVITLGRKHINDVHLDNPSVSGSHAKILTVGNDSFLEDLNSTNGTYVNNEKIDKKPLKDQDLVKIGEFQLRYLNSVVSADSDMEKTVILQAGSVTMQDPEAPAPAAPLAETPIPVPSPIAASSGNETAKLTVVDGPSQGKSLTLSKLLTRVKGPKGQSNVISKKDDGYYFLNTLTEGAPILNGKQIGVGSTKLENGDIIAIGSNQLKFSVS